MVQLNLGASNVSGKYKHGWINLDLVKHKGIQVIGSGLQLPFKDNSVDLIHCVHVLEHVTRDKNEPMLAEMVRVLKPGSLAYVEVPDFRGTIEKLVSAFMNDDRHQIHVWTTSVYGKNERKGMAHYWGFDEDLLRIKMRRNGFREVRRINSIQNMISDHHKQEPVLLMVGVK